MPLMEITGGKKLRGDSQTGDAVSEVGVDNYFFTEFAYVVVR